MGGLLKVPSLVFSGQLVFIAKLWLSQILAFQCDLLTHGYSHPLLRSETIYVNDLTGKLMVENINGV